MKSKIEALLEEKFKEEGFKDCFLVEISIQKSNKIEVFVDSDSGITFKKCQQLSRYLEQHFDEEQWFGQKYVLEVSSPGITRPLKFVRQYQKNIGRTVKITLLSGAQKEGVLKTVSDLKVTLEEKVKILEGKKKKTELQLTPITFKEIKETKVKITF